MWHVQSFGYSFAFSSVSRGQTVPDISEQFFSDTKVSKTELKEKPWGRVRTFNIPRGYRVRKIMKNNSKLNGVTMFKLFGAGSSPHRNRFSTREREYAAQFGLFSISSTVLLRYGASLGRNE